MWREPSGFKLNLDTVATRLSRHPLLSSDVLKRRGRSWTAQIEPPKSDHLCGGCGKTITKGRTHCAKCAVDSATQRLNEAARVGRIAGHTPEALAKESESQRRHATARSAWTAASQPAWLTDQMYSEKIQPLLGEISSSTIALRLGVSRWYAGRIRQGYRPHPRHWLALARLVGVSADVSPRESPIFPPG